MKIYISILLLFLTIFQTQSFAQSQKRLIKKAKKLELAGNLDQAAIFYEEASTNFFQTSTNGGCHNHGYLSFKAAECYRLTNQDTLAMFNYEKALLLNYADVEPKTLLYLGDYYCEQGECVKAIDYFNKYKLIVPTDTLVDRKITDCQEYHYPVFVDLWITVKYENGIENIKIRVMGTDGLDTLLFTNKIGEVKLESGIIKVGYDYSLQVLDSSTRLGNMDKFSTKNITSSRRIIREISILEGCNYGRLCNDLNFAKGARLFLSTSYIQNNDSAFYYFNQSAKNNNEEAMFYLGQMYFEGDGVEKNNDSSLYWCQKSAEKGNVLAQIFINDKLIFVDLLLVFMPIGYFTSNLIPCKRNCRN